MLRTITRSTATKASFMRVPAARARGMADNADIQNKAKEVGQKQETNPKNPSAVSSGGAIGKQFNPDGAIGQVGEKIGGPFSKDGAIGSQFDAAKDGIAGTVEKAVDGPSNPAKK
ncbi:hypothetical protein LTR66_008487 [Elasticomyces elasticus]|nr:hypothetical protein LTR66_008487 [Elasticomyces elasticus]KAK4992005.1 hypothetical protein LTR50_001401 [Elasticomyces elasticus]